MEAAKMTCGKQSDGRDTDPQRDSIASDLQFEITDATDKDVSDNEIQKPPEHVHGR